MDLSLYTCRDHCPNRHWNRYWNSGRNWRISYRILPVLLAGLVGLALLWSCRDGKVLNDRVAVLPGETVIPEDPDYTRGVLDNGLHYSIRSSEGRKDRMLMYLGLNVGSLQEEDDQRGLAHFLEHMAFNGSENFPGNSLVEFARQNGMSFGAHINAYTGFTDTVYNFVLPTDNEEILDRGLLVLYDWLNGLTIEAEEVEKERGVVLNEWRAGLGFTERFRDIWLPLVLEGSEYENRLPIGLADVIENAPPQRLRDFYKKWYNTNNAIVVIVGDFVEEEMEQRLQKLFGSIEPRGERLSSGLGREWKDVPIRAAITDEDGKLRPAVWAVQMQDDEAPARSVLVSIKTPLPEIPKTVAGFRQRLISNLLSVIVNQRFSDVITDQSSIVSSMSGFGREGTGNVMNYSFDVQAQKGHLKEAYGILLKSVARLKKYGVLQSEMDLGMETLRSNIEIRYNERESRENEDLAGPELRRFQGTHFNGDIVWIYENFDGIIGGITLEQLNGRIAEVLEGTDVSIMSFGKDVAELPDEQEMIDGYLELDRLEVTKPKEESLPDRLLETKPEPGDIVAEERLPKTGYVHWTLSNGLEVYFKNTDFEENQIEYSARRFGGILTLGEESGPGSLVQSLLNGVVSDSGFAGLSPEQYGRYMSPMKIGNSWNFQSDGVGLSGGGDLDDVEELFQQIYLSFTAPQFSRKLIEQGLKDLRTDYDDMLTDPTRRFFRLVEEHWYENDYRLLIPPSDQLPDYTVAELEGVFNQLVPGAKGFHFVFVGDIAESDLKEYVRQYIAVLPVDRDFTASGDHRISIYKEGGVKNFALGPDNQANTLSVWDTYLEPERFPDEQSYRLVKEAELLSGLFTIRVTKVLREELGKTYSPSGFVQFEGVPQNRMLTIFNYSSAPEDVEELDVTADRLIAEVREGQIEDSEFRQIKEQLSKRFEDDLQSNGFWHGVLTDALWNGYADLDEMISEDKFRQVLESISKQDLADFVQKYIPQQRKVRYTMLPKEDS
ncbi:insulinase family protein [Candidatus Haliotispira prima]|uniref:Insulinase family protein n=1 Tax=Candidatus Haliotispira prima TaxID=3034016 RepID=A0ABY8MEQ9_9SPIO|nr:insulinase family protein [Candidatus Haliotispira prima]